MVSAENEFWARRSAEVGGAGSHDLAATATITNVRHTGEVIDYEPVFDVDLTVFVPDGRSPYSTTVRQAMSGPQVPQATIGTTLRVAIDPSNAQDVAILWAP